MSVDPSSRGWNEHRHRGIYDADAGWTEVPSFLNSWVVFGSGLYNPAYFKDALGFVCLRGIIKSGVIGSVAFVLPPGYRPGNSHAFAVDSNNAYGKCFVESTGNVTPLIGSNVFFWLDGVRFQVGA